MPSEGYIWCESRSAARHISALSTLGALRFVRWIDEAPSALREHLVFTMKSDDGLEISLSRIEALAGIDGGKPLTLIVRDEHTDRSRAFRTDCVRCAEGNEINSAGSRSSALRADLRGGGADPGSIR
jgi:hypothetical protein